MPFYDRMMLRKRYISRKFDAIKRHAEEYDESKIKQIDKGLITLDYILDLVRLSSSLMSSLS